MPELNALPAADPCLDELDVAELVCAEALRAVPALSPEPPPEQVAALLTRIDDELALAGVPVSVCGLSGELVTLRHHRGPSTVVVVPQAA